MSDVRAGKFYRLSSEKEHTENGYQNVLFIAVQPPIQQIDLGFALSAASVFQNETFKLMKDTISYIIETYGTEKIHYSVLVFGNTATTKITFGQTPPSPEQLKSAIQRISFGTGRADLAKALEKALKLFEDAAGSRPLTHKVWCLLIHRVRIWLCTSPHNRLSF